MTDIVPETAVISRLYCPGCEVDADPMKEILDVLWCDTHRPDSSGAVDHVVTPSGYISGSGEAGGNDNKAYCDFFHRGPHGRGRNDTGDVPGLQ